MRLLLKFVIFLVRLEIVGAPAGDAATPPIVLKVLLGLGLPPLLDCCSIVLLLRLLLLDCCWTGDALERRPNVILDCVCCNGTRGAIVGGVVPWTGGGVE